MFEGLNSAALDPLTELFRHERPILFRAAAARLNLGFLLLGGGASLAILALGTALRVEIGLSNDSAMVLFWLVVAQGAPAIFGAFDVLLFATSARRSITNLTWFFAIASSLAIYCFGRDAAVNLAFAYAGCQIMFSAIAATVVIRELGIWPGVTAVLHRQIKLL